MVKWNQREFQTLEILDFWIVSYKLCSRWHVSPKDSLDCSTIKKCTSSWTGLENVFNIILASQNSGDIDIGVEDIKSQQANNTNLSLNHVIEPSTQFFNEPQNPS